MKHLLLSALALVICIGSNAQQPILKAEATYRDQASPGSYYLSDSIVFIYSNSRNSKANIKPGFWYADKNYHYDTALLWRNTNATTLKKTALLTQTFNSDDSIDIMYDYNYDINAQVYKPVAKRQYYYNSNHTIDSMIEYSYSTVTSTWTNNFRSQYTYDGNGNMAAYSYEHWYGTIPAWHYTAIDSYRYNSSNKIIQSKTKHYHYSTFVLEDSVYHRYTYDGTGLVLLNDTTFTKDSLPQTARGYHYDVNGIQIMDSAYGYSPGTQTWARGGKREYKYDASGNRIQITSVNWDKVNSIYYETQKQYYYYNTFNQLIKDDGIIWYNNSWKPDGSYRYLYYDQPNAVDELPAAQQKMSLYPIPATTYINLDLNFDNPQSFSVIIFDMQGRMVKQFTDKADKTYHKNIIVQDMPAGQYMLQVKTNAETLTRNFTIIR